MPSCPFSCHCAVAAVVAVLTYPDRLIALLPVVGNFACIGCMWTGRSISPG